MRQTDTWYINCPWCERQQTVIVPRASIPYHTFQRCGDCDRWYRFDLEMHQAQMEQKAEKITPPHPPR